MEGSVGPAESLTAWVVSAWGCGVGLAGVGLDLGAGDSVIGE